MMWVPIFLIYEMVNTDGLNLCMSGDTDGEK